jgi:hypothetical protein
MSSCEIEASRTGFSNLQIQNSVQEDKAADWSESLAQKLAGRKTDEVWLNNEASSGTSCSSINGVSSPRG